MGRARRNQRDAIRKSRAKRRNRGKNSSDDSSVEQPRIQHVAKKQKTSTVATAEINLKRDEDKSSSTVPSVEEPSSNKSAASSTEQPNTAPIKSEEQKETNKSEGEQKETSKKPLDKIERMRLKKQQQKARRKEKKAAREAALSK